MTVNSYKMAVGHGQRFFSLFYDWSVCSTVRGPHLTLPKTTSIKSQVRHFHEGRRRHNKAPSVPQDEPALSTSLRDLMRTMPHSVVVATASTGSPNPNGIIANFRGMTISSFTTLTLTPTPIITFNIRKPSQTLDAIRQTRQFLIHILSATESGARVADSFTKGNSQDPFHSKAFAVLRLRGGAVDKKPPLLAAPGITKVLRCRLRPELLDGLIEIGDHVLVLGDVVSIIEPPKLGDEDVQDGGLCYLDREYREVGSKIALENEANSS